MEVCTCCAGGLVVLRVQLGTGGILLVCFRAYMPLYIKTLNPPGNMHCKHPLSFLNILHITELPLLTGEKVGKVRIRKAFILLSLKPLGYKQALKN